MTKRRYGRAHSSAGVFVFLLLGVFGVFAVFMVILTAQLYRNTVADGEAQNNRRILSNYFINVIHSGDANGMIATRDYNGEKMLVISWPDEPWDDNDIADADEEINEESEEDNYIYETLIYFHDGRIIELLKTTKDEFVVGSGEVICNAKSFQPQIEAKLVTIRIKDVNGKEQDYHIRLYAAGEEASV